MYTGIILNPTIARFEELVFENVLAVEVDRAATRIAEDWSDLGPHAAFIDTPELRTTVKLTRTLGAETIADGSESPSPGRLGTLTFYTAPHWSDASRKRIRVRCVITAVEHTLANVSARQTITALAVSTDGAADPVTIDDPPIGSEAPAHGPGDIHDVPNVLPPRPPR